MFSKIQFFLNYKQEQIYTFQICILNNKKISILAPMETASFFAYPNFSIDKYFSKAKKI